MKGRLSIFAVVVVLAGSALGAPAASDGSTCRDGSWSPSEGRCTCEIEAEACGQARDGRQGPLKIINPLWLSN